MKENLHSMRDAGGDGHEIDRFRCSREASDWNILCDMKLVEEKIFVLGEVIEREIISIPNYPPSYNLISLSVRQEQLMDNFTGYME